MAHIYVEIIYDSRNIENARTGFRETFVVDLCLDPSMMSTGFPNAEFLGYSDEIVALEYAYSIFPEIRYVPDYSGASGIIILQSIKLEQRGRYHWRATAEYVYNVNSGTGGDRTTNGVTLPYTKINFTIGGGTKTVMKSLETKDLQQRNGGIIPDIPDPIAFGLIGYSDEGGVEGTEVPDSTFRLQITAYYLPSAVTMSYAMTLKALVAGKNNTGSYNSGTYLGRPSGEVSYLSASGGGTVVDVIPITHEFAIANNVSNEPDPGFPNLTMLGHDVVDYSFMEEFDDAKSKKLILFPQFRTVHRVRSPEDYSQIRIPGV